MITSLARASSRRGHGLLYFATTRSLSSTGNTDIPADLLQDDDPSQVSATLINTLSDPSVASTIAAAVPSDSLAGGADVGSFLSAGMSAIDGFHSLTGLPWWATIAATAVSIRTIMMPISLKGMKAGAALFPLIKQARQQLESEQQQFGAVSTDWQQQQTDGYPPESTSSSDSSNKPKFRVDPSVLMHRFHSLRLKAGAPHPIWVLGSPLVQLPTFILAMSSVRTMSLQNWPGFSTGGTAWCPDLTAAALDLTTLTAPLGSIGITLPLVIAVSMHANIQSAFGGGAAAGGNSENATMVWVLNNLKLVLEWSLVPLFVIALQLPHGALCYWSTSSLFALSQNLAFKLAGVRQKVGLPLLPQAAAISNTNNTSSLTAAAAANNEIDLKEVMNAQNPKANSNSNQTPGLASSGGAEPHVVLSDGAPGTISQAEEAAAFQEAASLHASGDSAGASQVLHRILGSNLNQAKAHFALGQVGAALKDWDLSETHYTKAAQLEKDGNHQQARAWFGAAVAMHMGGKHEAAIKAFSKAAKTAQSGELKVRCWVSQATLHQKLGRKDEAVKLLERAAKIEPKVEELYLKPLLLGNEKNGL